MVLRLAADTAGLDPIAKLRLVQREVNRRIRWMHDLDNMGVADFWANAGETLRRGTGDSEDIAIVKMQVLKAAGFSPKDLYISIGRHNVRGAHVVLLARAAGGFYVLDDTNTDLMTPAQHGRFTPIMTLGQGVSWIHGRRTGGTSCQCQRARPGATRALRPSRAGRPLRSRPLRRRPVGRRVRTGAGRAPGRVARPAIGCGSSFRSTATWAAARPPNILV